MTAFLLSLGIPDWAVAAVGSTLVLLAFGVALGIGLWIDELRRGYRRNRDWSLPCDSLVIRPRAYQDMRGIEPDTDENLSALLRKQAG